MLFQLGNIVFKGLLGPSSFSVEGIEAVYAEHQLLSGKSRLQPTGSLLEEITMDIKFHVEYCRPDAQIQQLKTAINNNTVMPLLMGNGKVVNNYVVISAPYQIDEMFSDGATKAASLTLTIREYISQDKLKQKELEGYKSAFAIGDQNPVTRRGPQPELSEKLIARDISGTKQQVSRLGSLVTDYQNNVSKREAIGQKIMDTCKKANEHMESANQKLNDARQVENKFTCVRGAVTSVKTAVSGISNLYPFSNATDLLNANNYLQSTTGILSSTTAPLLSLVAVRQNL